MHVGTSINPLSADPTKWPNTLKQFVDKLPTNCLSVFGHFVNLALKGLICIKNQFFFLTLGSKLNQTYTNVINAVIFSNSYDCLF